MAARHRVPDRIPARQRRGHPGRRAAGRSHEPPRRARGERARGRRGRSCWCWPPGACAVSTLPGLLALAGFCQGITGPSRDMLVRAATPPGASGQGLRLRLLGPRSRLVHHPARLRVAPRPRRSADGLRRGGRPDALHHRHRGPGPPQRPARPRRRLTDRAGPPAPAGAGPACEAGSEEASPVPELRVGISGWRYRPWRGTFYPPGWPQARELEYAARHLNSVELNGSFYSLQRPESYQRVARRGARRFPCSRSRAGGSSPT